MQESVYVGVDLGGTAIKVGICDGEGRLLHRYEGSTEPEEGAEAVIRRIADMVRRTVEESPFSWEQVAGVGVGIAAFLDPGEGTVLMAPNLGWKNVPIKRLLEAHLNKRVEIDNDANAAALGEAWSGAGHGIRHLVCYTIGTGVGGGIIADGNIYRGFKGMAGEIGHIQIVPDLEAVMCGCGHLGCLETVSSATGIVRMANDAKKRGDKTVLAEIERITAKDVFDAAKQGDELAKRIVERAAFYLGKSMAFVAVILNPRRFVVGGGISQAGDILFAPIREAFDKFAPEAAKKEVDIVPAALGSEAGIIGAARLVVQ